MTAALLPLLALLGTASSEALAVRAGRLYTGEGAPLENAILLVRDGRVLAVGRDVEIPADASILDARDAVVVPGFVAADSSLGEGSATARESISPHYRAVDGFDPFARYDRVLSAGVTTAYLSPGRRRLLGGTGAVAKLAGKPGARVLLADSDLRIEAVEGALGPPMIFEPPIPPSADDPILPARRQLPGTRLGSFLALRRIWDEAFDYRQMREGPSEGRPPRDVAKEALADAIEIDLPLRIACEGTKEIEAALRFLAEVEMRGLLEGGAEAWRMAEAIAAAGAPVVLALPDRPGKAPFEAERSEDATRWRRDAAARLAAAGIRMALVPRSDAELPDLPALVDLAVRGGLERSQALAAVTSAAAQILGVSDRVGSLAPGKDADFLVLSGEPFEPTTHVIETWVGGERVFVIRRADAVVVRAGTILPGSSGPIRGGAVLVEKGKIVAVGRTVPTPPGARVLDAGEAGFVTPGLVDASSLLGLEGDPGQPAASVPIALALSPGKRGLEEAASAGVTTILLAPARGAFPGGSRVAAAKTHARSRPAQIVRETAAILFEWRGGDRATRPVQMREHLKRAKEYAQKWDRYLEERKKPAEPEKKEKAEEPKAEEEKAPPPDPVSGTWEGEVDVPFNARPVKFVLEMKLEGTSISGSIDVPVFGRGPIPFSGGRFDAGKISFAISTPVGEARVEATIDRPDHFAGVIRAPVVGEIRFEATRTKRPAGPAGTPGRKAKGPQKPDLDENLEPFRALLRKEIVALVDADRADEIERALEVFAEIEAPVVVRGGADAWRIARALSEKKVGVVVPPGFVRLRGTAEVNLPDRLAREGVALAFATGADAGTRDLFLSALHAVRRGMDPDAALRALTVDPARLFKIDDRVGALEPGRDGDLVLWSGDPFAAGSRILAVVAGGDVLEEEAP